MTTTYPDFLGNSSLQTDTEHWEMEGGAQEVSVTYVLDTSVLLSDPLSLTRFAEHDVVLPIVVITELEAKRHHPDLGFFARQALRMLDELREIHGICPSHCQLAMKADTSMLS